MPTKEGVKPIATFDPFKRVEAETIGDSKGITTEQNVKDGVYVTDIKNGSWIKVRNVDLKNGAANISVQVASASQGGYIDVYADSISKTPMAVIPVAKTGGWEYWTVLNAELHNCPSGVHDIIFAFRGQKGRKLMNFNWWEMK